MKKILFLLIVAMTLFWAVATAEVVPETAPVATIDLTGIALALIELTLAFLAYKVWPWIKSKTTETQQKALINAAEVAVFAAEKVIGGGNGTEKLNRVRNHLREKGYNIDSKEVGDAIEAAVQKLPGQIFVSCGTLETVDSEETNDEEPDDEDTDPQ